jgi:protein-S-isoprenylcysteine O-methyltransferase Ste14
MYNIVSMVTSAFLGAAVLLLPDASLYRIPLPWVMLTLSIQVLAGIGFIISLRQTDTLQFTGLDVFISSKNSSIKTPLTTTGYYALVRHPLYFLAFVIMWLFPLMTWNLLALFIGLTLYTLSGSLLEERRLLQEFGTEYAEYQKRTPWIIPNPFRKVR